MRRLEWRPRRPWPFRTSCNLCSARVTFTSITDDLGPALADHGFPYTLDEFETLNHRAYVCPRCGSSDRDRLYKLYVDEFLDVTQPLSMVEFAPSAPLSAHLRSLPGVVYRTADLMMEGVDDQVDITAMPTYADQSLDFFICSHVLEHVSDDRQALSELYRVLKPGGRGLVMTPIAPEGSFDEDPSVDDPSERWRRFAQDDHVRLYDRRTLTARVRAAGFDLATMGWKSFGPHRFLRHGISLGSVLYVVTRPAA